jgi:geranylgeranyl reductase family protein
MALRDRYEQADPVNAYDVAVVGAGPAGSAAALAACRAGASVVMLDRAAFPRDKPCGDGIAPPALDVLARLGVPDAADGYAPVAMLRLVSPGGAVVARAMRRPAYTIPRRVFDARLVEAAVAAGATLRRQTVRRIDRAGVLLTVDGAVTARVVIGADGAGSVVRRLLGHPTNPDGHLVLAIRGYGPAPDGMVRDGVAEQRIVSAVTQWPAYAWAFPIGDGRANVGYGELLRGRPVTRAHLLDRLAALLPEFDPAAIGELRAHLLPLSTRRPPVGRGPVLLAGDALSLINPITGEGIFYAVASGAAAGAAAAEAVRRGDPASAAARYRASFARRLGVHLRHSTVAATLIRHRRVVDGAVRAAAADQRVFDAMVELGLGDGRLDPMIAVRIARRVAG